MSSTIEIKRAPFSGLKGPIRPKEGVRAKSGSELISSAGMLESPTSFVQ